MKNNTKSLLFKGLQNPALFPHKVEYFKIIETHISWVLLTGHYAYKIKKPLNLGFLDFSSLEKRHYYCLEELRLNSRLAKDIYLDVVAITGTEEQPKIEGSGAVIEYAVKMKQFEYDKTFDQLLTQKQLTTEHIKQLANIIATFHNRIECAPVDTEFGSANAVLQPVRENFKQIQQLNGIEKPECLKQLESWSEQQYIAHRAFFKQRKQSGFIRECHGDLHLGNIALINDQTVPFDGIEFNPSLYWIDVISDIAFLVMDLQSKQRHDLAFQFLNEYLQYSGDYAGLKLLRFYLVYRAIVMSKVSAIRASQRNSAKERQLDITKYHSYLQLANCYTETVTPIMIIMHGVSGSGKSWLAEQIYSRYQAIRIRSDVERKRWAKLSPIQKSHSGMDSGLYTQANNDIIHQHLLQLAIETLRAGYHVIVDATFLQQQYRDLFFQQAELLQVPFVIVNSQADKTTLLKRIKGRAKLQDNISEADQTILENQLDNIQALNNEELKYSITIDTNQTRQVSMLWEYLDDRCQSCHQR